MTPVGNLIEGKVVPVLWNEGVDSEGVLVLKNETAQPGNDQVDKSRVKVVFAPIVKVVMIPASSIRVKSFGNVRLTILAMGASVNMEQFVVILPGNMILTVVVKKVGETFEGLGGSEGPTLSAPPATAVLKEEQGVVSLYGDGTEVREKIGRIHEEFPGLLVSWVREVKGPGDIPGFFPAMGASGKFTGFIDPGVFLDAVTFSVFLIVPEHREKEFAPGVPEFLLHGILQGSGLLLIAGGSVMVAEEVGYLRESLKVGPHVAVKTWTIAWSSRENVFCLAAGNIEFHAVVMADLPKHAGLLHP